MMLLSSPTPAEFLATHLERRQAKDDVGEVVVGEWQSLGELLSDDAQALREIHSRLVDAGTPSTAAANYVAGWIGGLLSGAVGFTHATTGSGLLSDPSVRWRFHPGGWPDRVDVSGVRVVVAPGHEWSGLPGVDVVGDINDVRRLSVTELVVILTPVVEILRTLAKVGHASLWAEVADGLGTATAGWPELGDSAGTIASLEAMLAIPDVPWRVRPHLWCAQSDSGALVVGRKGGCCLAYTRPTEDDEGDIDDGTDYGTFQRRFPRANGEPAYCSTCRLRTRDDVEARQLFWADLTVARRASPVKG